MALTAIGIVAATNILVVLTFVTISGSVCMLHKTETPFTGYTMSSSSSSDYDDYRTADFGPHDDKASNAWISMDDAVRVVLIVAITFLLL